MHSGFTWPVPAAAGGVGNLVLNQGGSVAEHDQSRTFAVGE